MTRDSERKYSVRGIKVLKIKWNGCNNFKGEKGKESHQSQWDVCILSGGLRCKKDRHGEGK